MELTDFIADWLDAHRDGGDLAECHAEAELALGMSIPMVAFYQAAFVAISRVFRIAA